MEKIRPRFYKQRNRRRAFSFGKKRGNAILTLKEWRENGKKIYALKLENLEKGKS